MTVQVDADNRNHIVLSEWVSYGVIVNGSKTLESNVVCIIAWLHVSNYQDVCLIKPLLDNRS